MRFSPLPLVDSAKGPNTTATGSLLLVSIYLLFSMYIGFESAIHQLRPLSVDSAHLLNGMVNMVVVVVVVDPVSCRCGGR